ncbi:CBS domain-containing protein [Prescottella defluvii]|uniref:CBS domain-containing protein n=1 Tax=Prescottella defluvii TaxID=1323361 RepID=UPI0005634F6C|nr:CBS domain-containing protein [Prescottella defluvii]
MRAGDIMERGVVTVGEHASLADAVGLLCTDPRATLHVVDAAGHLVGLVTAAHLLEPIRAVLAAVERSTGGDATTDTVADAMSTPVVAVRADTDIGHLAAALTDTDTVAVAVVDGFTPIGTVTRLELVRALTGLGTRQRQDGGTT